MKNPDEEADGVQNLCKYCLEACDPQSNPGLQCTGNCAGYVHVKCLKRGGPPGSFIGDVFFHLNCTECSAIGEETVTRMKMSWLNILILTLYNLRNKSYGISKRGYFHWKSDISTFVDKNWDYLFQKSVKKRKNWIGTISGTLSHYSTVFFQSGTAELGESGWWRLISQDPPEILTARNLRMIVDRKRLPPVKLQEKQSVKKSSPPCSESSLSVGDDSNATGESSRIHTPSMFSREYVQPSEILSDFLLADDEIPGMDPLDIENEDSAESKIFANLLPDSPTGSVPFTKLLTTFSSDWMTEIFKKTDDTSEMENKIETSEDSLEATITAPPSSLFTARSGHRPHPWINKVPAGMKKTREKMNKQEISYFLQSISPSHLESAHPRLRRLYRKLHLRRLKLDSSLSILDIDKFTARALNPPGNLKNRVIDRFCNNIVLNFDQRLQGHAEPTSIVSPYTNRILKPFIRRDEECTPLWLELMENVVAKAKKINPKLPGNLNNRGSIDYCYVRPQHIPAINSLCSEFFWPGIDLTECLQFPDFTCVVLYKKIIIGFAVLVPDVGYNEAYISFFFTRPEWRRSGIGTFMLYHLIQTCMGKDLTLHVSVTNSAIILYQKFGFKVEEFVQDFYDKYMAPGPRESRHAFFLRLSR